MEKKNYKIPMNTRSNILQITEIIYSFAWKVRETFIPVVKVSFSMNKRFKMGSKDQVGKIRD